MIPRAVLLGSVVVGMLSIAGGGFWLSAETLKDLRPVARDFAEITATVNRTQLLDRSGRPLNLTYVNDWNLHDHRRLYEIPDLAIHAFLEAEDQRFFSHQGPDWIARIRALLQNVLALRAVSGASTITEQVVRMIHPRPRTLWSRWLEGWEASQLERKHSKLDILEFYLNQVPYAANRRGVAQAAHYYFDRDLDTLSDREILALAVLVRAPSRLDLWKSGLANSSSMEHLADRMRRSGFLTPRQHGDVLRQTFDLQAPTLDIKAGHFLEYASRSGPIDSRQTLTTLDGSLQVRLQDLLDKRIETLASSNVTNGALLAANHRTGEVLAWVVGGANERSVAGSQINAVITPRQPGSALKPFLYALALEKGWTATTLINDAPLAEMVGTGLHSYSNYSRMFYGPITLRNALGNSLNIPALRAIQYVGAPAYLERLQDLGFETLARHPDVYGDGLALGNGEVTLLELVTAYSALAKKGVYRQLVVRKEEALSTSEKRVYGEEVASLIGNILSDPSARALEFGRASLLNLPVQTAVKTGTSSDYRDSWAVGYDHSFVVGVWMGNLNQTSTHGITGSTGPALVLRSAFDLLNRDRNTRPLWLSPNLARHVVCADSVKATAHKEECSQLSEYFLPGTSPMERSTLLSSLGSVPNDQPPDIRLRQPTPGLRMALDPRLPVELQAFEFELQGALDTDVVEWRIDGGEPEHGGRLHLWPLQRGSHFVSVVVHRGGELAAQIPPVKFFVK